MQGTVQVLCTSLETFDEVGPWSDARQQYEETSRKPRESGGPQDNDGEMFEQEGAEEGGEDGEGEGEKLKGAEGGCQSEVGLFGEVGWS
jgi:hypothetical protein